MAVKSIQFDGHTFDIGYEILNPEAKTDLIVLHGWGSNKSLMKQAFCLYMKDFRHIYIDMPGFGTSTCEKALYTKDYAKIIELFITSINASKDIIAGHSFGGKVALLLEPKLLVLLSSAGIYVAKPIKVRAKIALYKLLKVFGLSRFREFFVADDAKRLTPHMYDTFKNVVDEDFGTIFSAFKGKALLCWGKEDTATPLSSALKIEKLINDSKLVVYSGDHYFFLNHAEDISRNIEKTFLETLEHN